MTGTDTPAVHRSGCRRPGLLALCAAALLASCDGETLYETAVDVAPPDVRIASPVTGQQLTSGRSLAVEIEADDTLGVRRVELTWSGVASGIITFDIVPARLSVALDTVIALPAASGDLVLNARAENTLGAVSPAARVELVVQPFDTIAPTVARSATVPQRMELTDSVTVAVSARDNSGGTGIARIGATVLFMRPLQGDTIAVTQSLDLTRPSLATTTGRFAFAPAFVDPASLPVGLQVEVHAFAVDSAGNCAAARAATEQRQTCIAHQNGTIAAGVATPPDPVTVVSGRSIPLPAGSNVPDLVPDIGRGRVYLSNFGRNRIDILTMSTRTFAAPVAVGSQPWGIEINRGRDSLIVANSGGTNLSFVTLGGTPAEVVSARVQTPNSVLFHVNVSEDANGIQRLGVSFFDFSDRPQYVAQDASGRLLYSTLPTSAAALGTLRVAERQTGWDATEVRLLLGNQIFIPDSTFVAVAHVDSMRVFTSAGGDGIVIFDHVTGFPNTIVTSGPPRPLFAALDSLSADPRSDIAWSTGRFDLAVIGLSDTTFVAASDDRNRIAFGEGSTSHGRVIMWHAPTQSISNEITVADLVGNSAEHITGIDLNQDGSFNTARGLQAAYSFRQDLRLQGHAPTPGAPGGGAVLHPNHPTGAAFASGPTTVAFVAAGQSIRIFDTVHFHQRGEIATRDALVGPLRASPPLPGETAGCPGAGCMIARLYGITSRGTVVLIEVRSRDIQ